MRGATYNLRVYGLKHKFQSTPPVRGATPYIEETYDSDGFQSTPPVRGATRQAPRVSRAPPEFQSTPPVRGATLVQSETIEDTLISIHAPRAGGDFKGRYGRAKDKYFNPRPPCGGRPNNAYSHANSSNDFNPRPPCGGRRVFLTHMLSTPQISIHAPRAGGNFKAVFIALHKTVHFNPRPPCGGRRLGKRQ